MSGFSDYAEAKVLNHIIGKANWSVPGTWVVLCSGAISDADTGLTLPEMTGGGMVRKQVVVSAWVSATTSTGQVTNNEVVTFATPTSDVGTATYFAIADSSVMLSGNIIAYASLSASKTISNADVVQFLSGTLVWTLS